VIICGPAENYTATRHLVLKDSTDNNVVQPKIILLLDTLQLIDDYYECLKVSQE
jgi:hypothetical protein